MHRDLLRAIALTLTVTLTIALSPSTAVAAVDGDIPGLPLPATPASALLDADAHPDVVYSVWLNAQDTLQLTLTRTGTCTAGFFPNLYLYAPNTLSTATSSPFIGVEGLYLPKSISYTASSAGLYYVNVHEPVSGEQGTASLAWKVLSPVYRFYNFTNNTHFFTPSTEERDAVIAKWPNVFTYEGIAYYLNPANNTQPLYRFYNRVSRSHFYTPSAQEAATVIARYSNVYSLDGLTYAVNPGPVTGSAPIYRFYNVRNGSHFYTASPQERDTVIANWPSIYHFEGITFWIGQ